MATTSSTAKPTSTVVDIEAAPTVVVTATAPRAGCKPCKTAAFIVGTLIAIAGAFAAGYIIRGHLLSPRVTHKLTVDGDNWRGAGILDIEETARYLIHDRRAGTKSAIVHVAAEEVDASQSVRAHFVAGREPSYPQQRRLAPTDADKDSKAKGKDENWTFEAVEVKMGEVVTEADVPEGARKQFLSEDGTGTFAFKLLDEKGHEIEKLECDDSMRCHKEPRDEEEHQTEHGEEHETYTCWTVEDEHGELVRDEHEDEQERLCAIVTVTIPAEEPRTCLKDIQVPCPIGSMGRKADGHCVKHVEFRC